MTDGELAPYELQMALRRSTASAISQEMRTPGWP